MFKRWYLTLLFVVILIPGVYVIKPWPWVIEGGQVAPMMDRPECAHGTMFADSSGHQVPRPVSIAISGSISEIPEYHDCQRLLLTENASRRYGPLIAIYVRINVRAVRDPLGFVPATTTVPASTGYGTTGVLNAAGGSNITVPPINVTSSVPVIAPEDGTQQAVVTILNYGKGGYDPLQIGEKKYSCLYVYDGGDKQWHAKIQQVGSDTDCKRPLSDWPDAKSLSVNVVPESNPAPATRWDWDVTNKEHFIGLPCGSSWCEVYRHQATGFGSSRVDPGMGKGWTDEQYLAEETTASGHPDNLIPGASAGTAVPIGDLPSYDYADGAVFKGTWIPVARVSLSEPSPVYDKKYKYQGGPAPYGQSIVYLCKGTKQECLPLWMLTIKGCGNAQDPWWARVESPSGTRYKCVIRRKPMDTTAPLPPGMVRWRWKLQDEGMWIRCPGGCCEKT